MKPDDQDDFFLFDMPEFDPLFVCVFIAAILAAFGIGLGLYEVVRALVEGWV